MSGRGHGGWGPAWMVGFKTALSYIACFHSRPIHVLWTPCTASSVAMQICFLTETESEVQREAGQPGARGAGSSMGLCSLGPSAVSDPFTQPGGQQGDVFWGLFSLPPSPRQ